VKFVSWALFSKTEIIACAPPISSYLGTMDLDWQQVVSLLIVFAAAVLLFGNQFRRRRFNPQRLSHCGCSANSPGRPPGSIVFRARKGVRPEIIVKMT
jgi:hypothetical protein